MKRLLVANRGEIAVRIFRTCRRLGIETVAVAAPDDREALHARSADRVLEIESYLDAVAIVQAAREAAADAVHPGYGFLAESAGLAEAVESAGIAFVGPTADALRQGGDKLAAKEIAREAGVPVVPHGEPEEIGYPLVVKAAAGGGGRGMRVVRAPGELEEALAAARREAGAAFGDDRVFCERYVERPRHVEIQLLADSSGTVVALGERDCSIQRRHQKVLEETPSPAIDDELRQAMSDAAVAFGRAIGYRSAGTAEFMVDGRDFYFLELNGRIQVEHPVTELVTGIDLVEQQIRIARGEPLVTSSYKANGARGRGTPLRGGSGDVPAADRAHLTAAAAVGRACRCGRRGRGRDRPSLRPVDREAHRPWPHTGGRARPTRLGARRHRGRRRDHEPPLSPLARRASTRTRRATDDRVPRREPAARAAPGPTPAAWHGAWRLNGSPPPPEAPPDTDDASHSHGAVATESTLAAQMPGTVLRVLVSPGEAVTARQPLLVLEAMKMETPVVSPHDATVRRLLVAEGDQVAAGTELVELDD